MHNPRSDPVLEKEISEKSILGKTDKIWIWTTDYIIVLYQC